MHQRTGILAGAAAVGLAAAAFGLALARGDDGSAPRAYLPELAADSAPPVTSTATMTPTATTTAPATSPAGLRTLTVSGSGQAIVIEVELATTFEQRATGLMGRESLADTAGMLFIFEGPQTGGFWMKDTLIPLDIAYLDAAGSVMEIKYGVPLSPAILTPQQPYRYVLEVAGGWFERKGMGVGASVEIP